MQVLVDGVVTEYLDTGNGPTLLFLHGWQDSLKTFDALVSILQDDFRVIRVDLPGFGKSGQPSSVWNLGNYVDFVASFVKKLDLDVYAFLGHSMGGRITLKGMGEGKFQSQKIILIGSAGIARRKTFKNITFMLLAKFGKVITLVPPFSFFKDSLKRKLYQASGSDYLNAGVLRETFVKIINEDLSENAKKIKIPTLLIWGTDDTETPLADGRRLAIFITGSRLEILENAGHFVHKEKSEKVATFIREFLK